MTKSERRQVAATLREWAAWCEQSEHNVWYAWAGTMDRTIVGWAWDFCGFKFEDHAGPTAATGLLLAAEAVEAGDMP
jgi:hypothetical protein